MADYKELLRRAISALPENNGAARRAVYEKARAALVAQLRAISPPLPAREITQHRLQLEDCIRQVEHEASEAVITLGRDSLAQNSTPAPDPAPSSTTFTPPATPSSPPASVPREESKPIPFVPPPAAEKPETKTEAKPEPVEAKLAPEASVDEAEIEAPKPAAPVAPVEAKPASRMSIEDIISQAAASSHTEVEKTTPVTPVAPVTSLPPRQTPPVGDKPTPQSVGVAPRTTTTPAPAPLKGPVFAPRRDMAPAANAAPALSTGRIEPSCSGAALAHMPDLEAAAIAEVAPVEPALSSVREVEVEAADGTREAEGAIERAIETLDREARGEATDTLPDRAAAKQNLSDQLDDGGFATPDSPPRSGPGLTIFLVVFVLLLSAVGGAGYWAWREDYLPLDQMFGRATPAVVQTQNTETPATPSMDSPALPDTSANGAAGPGNTATTTTGEPTTALEGMEIEDRLEPTPEPVTPTGNETVLPSISSNGEVKTEERLSSAETSIAAEDPSASVDPAVLAGSQSLLLEASANGSTGAVPFSGTVDWTEGQDEIGLPTLIAKASIPARNLGVTVTIRKNSDPVLPASHLMEITFDVSDTFVGGSITSLPGVLLKDEELVPGAPLVGASARIVGNSFLFALSASPQDATTNRGLLETRRWMDLAVVYGTGRNAIITLEKDEAAQALFEKVFAAWAE